MAALAAALTLALAASAAASPAKVQSLVWTINSVRVRYHLPRLRVDPALAAAARRHSRLMARTHVFAHTRPLRFPPRSDAVGENLAWMPDDRAVDVVEAWLASPHHRRILLSPLYRWIGVGDVDGLVTADFAGCATQPC